MSYFISNGIFLVIFTVLLFGCSSYQLMIGPFVFIHPSEENEEQADQNLLLEWKSLFV